jgi:hypothetical protein
MEVFCFAFRNSSHSTSRADAPSRNYVFPLPYNTSDEFFCANMSIDRAVKMLFPSSQQFG